MPRAKSDTAPLVDSVAHAIKDKSDALCTSMRNEALGSIAIGVGIVVAVYWVIFVFFIEGITMVLGRMGYSLPFSSVIGTPLSLQRVGIAGVWFVIAAAIAWMQVSPFAPPEPPAGKTYDPFFDPPPSRIVRGEGSLGCFTQLFGSGPRNIFEGIAGLRDIPRVTSAMRTRAAELLVLAASDDGLNSKNCVRDDSSQNAMALLWRLKLIVKQPAFTARWTLVATSSGRALVGT